VALGVFEFSHSLGPKRTSSASAMLSAFRSEADV
jgi:hypothetical protein